MKIDILQYYRNLFLQHDSTYGQFLKFALKPLGGVSWGELQGILVLSVSAQKEFSERQSDVRSALLEVDACKASRWVGDRVHPPRT